MDLESHLRDLAPRILRYCLGRLREHSLAEEASQEALTALVDRWRRHGPPDSPAAFAFAVARRRAGRLAWRRRLTAPWSESVDGHNHAPPPDEIYAPRERLARTLAALATLPKAEREALLLVAAGELSISEAARAHGTTDSAIKMRVHRGRRRLLAILENHDDKSS